MIRKSSRCITFALVLFFNANVFPLGWDDVVDFFTGGGVDIVDSFIDCLNPVTCKERIQQYMRDGIDCSLHPMDCIRDEIDKDMWKVCENKPIDKLAGNCFKTQ